MKNETGEALIAAAQSLAPALRERAAWAEAQRALPEESHAAFVEHGFYRILQPARFGGIELDLAVMVDVAVALGRGCGSSAWVFTNLALQGWICGMKTPRAQEELWGDDDTALVASSFPGPGAKLRRVEGGFVVDGMWKFSSGIDYAAWNHLQLMWRPDGGPVQNLYAMVPASDYEVVDDWFVTGLAGTGSRSLTVRELFIPDYRITGPDDVGGGASPGSALNPGPLYRLPFWSLGNKAFAAPAVGIAQGALELIEEDLAARSSARGGVRLAAEPAVHVRLAESAAEIEAAWALLLRNCADAMRRAGSHHVPDLRRLAIWRRNTAYAVVLCRRAMERLVVLNGMRAMRPGDPVQRCWRDVQAAGAQVGVAWDTQAQLYGKARFDLLGSDPGP